MPGIPQKSEKTIEEMTGEKLSEAKMHDVLLLVENLVVREEYNIRHIIDCLYDVGSSNLIDAKIRSRSLKGISKLIIRLSKPAFKIVAWRWFKKNCPRLITNWLHKKVTFKEEAKPSLDNMIESETPLPENFLTDDIHNQLVIASKGSATFTPLAMDKVKMNSFSHLEVQQREFQSLHFQIRVLTGVLVGAIAVFSTGFIWLGYSIKFERAQNQKIEKADTRERPMKAVYSTKVEEKTGEKESQ
ncbi:MAG: hypothetical protein ACFB02_13660 [Mastigocoleus sp.]